MSFERSRREFLKQSAVLTALSAATLWRARPPRSRATSKRRRRSAASAASMPAASRPSKVFLTARARRARLASARLPTLPHGRGAGRAGLWAERAPARTRRGAYGVRARRRGGESAARGRGLPRAQRLDAGGRRRPPAAGSVLVPRWWVRHGLRFVTRDGRHQPRAPRRRRGRLRQPPLERARLHPSRGARRQRLRAVGRRRHARHRARARVGARQHRGVRRRRRQRHGLRPVGRRP